MRSECPICDRSVSVTGQLRFRQHRDALNERCLGGGLVPAELGEEGFLRLHAQMTAGRKTVSQSAALVAKALAFHPMHMTGQMTMSDIAAELGITRERVRQIYAEHDAPHGRLLSEQRAEARRLFNAVAVAAKLDSLPGRRHGTIARYHSGCHCAECREANRVRCYLNNVRNGTASAHVCEVCGEPVWRNSEKGRFRHFRTADHDPVPVKRVVS